MQILKTLRAWIRGLPPILALPAPDTLDTADSTEELVIVHPGAFFFRLLALLPVWEELTREEAAQIVLEREVRVRYRPLIVEMDRKTILNEVH